MITYILFRGDKRRVDLTNICAVVDKFFSDALVELGCIEDDSVEYIVETINMFGGYVEGESYVEINVEAV